MMIFRANQESWNTRFLYYVLTSPVIQNQITNLTSGSAVPQLPARDLKKFKLPKVPLSIQNRIEAIISSLSDKLSLNHQINQTLEQMAQAIFKSWFVDFEPVKAKIEAKRFWHALQPQNEPASPVCYAEPFEPLPDLDAYMILAAMQAISGKSSEQLTRLQTEQPEQYAELRTTAELFPSAMQESELGEIPEGWEAGSLNDIATFPNNRIATEELSLDTYVSTENMLEGRKGICRASSMPSSASVPSFEPKQILISNIRPYFKKIWFSNKSGGRSPDVLDLMCKHKNTSEFTYNLLYQDQFFDYMMLTSKGAKMPRGDKKAIMQFASVVPTIEIMQSFSKRVESFYDLITSNNRQSTSLVSVRDTLLPKLLSGELSVSNAESQLAEAEG